MSDYQGWRPKDGTMQGYNSLSCLTKCQSFYEFNNRKKMSGMQHILKKQYIQHSTSEIPLTAKRTTPEFTAALINWGALSNILGSWRWQCASNSLNVADNLAIPVYKLRGGRVRGRRISSCVRRAEKFLLMSAKELQLKSY